MAAVGTLGVIASIPGQTMGVSVFTDHLIGATGLSRLELSNAYLAGTVTSGLLLPAGGRWLDRFGARATALGATTGLALTLCLLSFIDHVAEAVAGLVGLPAGGLLGAAVLAVGFACLRFTGQGMLTMTSRNMLAKWFDRRRGTVAGLTGVFVSFGFAAAPLFLNALIDASDWRGAWLWLAAIIGPGMGGVAWAFYRDNPEECGLRMDGDAEPPPEDGDAVPAARTTAERPFTREEAIRTLAFWSITLALAAQGLIITAITFHIVDIGDESGLDTAESVAIFLPMAVLGTVVGWVGGVASDRVPIKWLVVVMMLFQALGLVSVGHLGHPPVYAAAVAGLGISQGFFVPLTTVALPRFFGRVHLGSIAGVQTMCLVLGTAAGPSLLALSRTYAGSYVPGLYGLCLLPAMALVLALFTEPPAPPPG